MAVPSEPADDAITTHIVTVYQMTARARRVVVGMNGGFALPLTVPDITDVLVAHPSPIPRMELDPCVFALDALDRAGLDEETDSDDH